VAEEQPPPAPGGDPWGTRKALEVLGLAFVFPVAVGLGFWGGSRIGASLGAPQLGGILGGALGAVAGFWELYRLVLRGEGPH
jgi:hypothetical protein